MYELTEWQQKFFCYVQTQQSTTYDDGSVYSVDLIALLDAAHQFRQANPDCPTGSTELMNDYLDLFRNEI